MEHIRFRAGYDFMLLRAESGQCDSALAQWWTDFIEADAQGRADLLAQAAALRGPSTASRSRRRRRKPSATPGDRSGSARE